MRKKDEELKGIFYINIVSILIGLFFCYENLPFWYYYFSNDKTNGEVINVITEKSEKEVTYQFHNKKGSLLKRYATFKTSVDVTKGDTIILSYNSHYPDYIYIDQLEETPNFYRTLTMPVITIFLVIFLTLGRYGFIQLNEG